MIRREIEDLIREKEEIEAMNLRWRDDDPDYPNPDDPEDGIAMAYQRGNDERWREDMF